MSAPEFRGDGLPIILGKEQEVVFPKKGSWVDKDKFVKVYLYDFQFSKYF